MHGFSKNFKIDNLQFILVDQKMISQIFALFLFVEINIQFVQSQGIWCVKCEVKPH